MECPCCTECKDCAPGLQKVIDLKNAGLIIYRHTTHTEDVDPKTGNVEHAVDRTEDVYILHNTTDKDVSPADYWPEIEQNIIKCPRCRKIKEQARNLLRKVPTISGYDVKGICDHCKMKDASCYECKEVVKRFFPSKPERTDVDKERVKHWLGKIKLLLDDKSKDKKISHSDIHTDQLWRNLKNPVREPDVEQLFGPNKFDSNSTIQPSTDKKKVTHFPQLEKLKHPILFKDPSKRGGMSSFLNENMEFSNTHSDISQTMLHAQPEKLKHTIKYTTSPNNREVVPQVDRHDAFEKIFEDTIPLTGPKQKANAQPEKLKHTIKYTTSPNNREVVPQVDRHDAFEKIFEDTIPLTGSKQKANAQPEKLKHTIKYTTSPNNREVVPQIDRHDAFEKIFEDTIPLTGSKQKATTNYKGTSKKKYGDITEGHGPERTDFKPPETKQSSITAKNVIEKKSTKPDKHATMDVYGRTVGFVNSNEANLNQKAHVYTKEKDSQDGRQRRYKSTETLVTKVKHITTSHLKANSIIFPRRSHHKNLTKHKSSSELIKDTANKLSTKAKEENSVVMEHKQAKQQSNKIITKTKIPGEIIDTDNTEKVKIEKHSLSTAGTGQKAPELAEKTRKDALKASHKTDVDDQKPALKTEKNAKRAEKDSQQAKKDARIAEKFLKDAKKATLKAEGDAKKAALKAELDAQKAALKAELDAQKAALIAEKNAKIAEKGKKAQKLAENSQKDALKASLKTDVDDQKSALKTEKNAKRAEKDSQQAKKDARIAEKFLKDAKKATLKAEGDAKKAALKAELDAQKAASIAEKNVEIAEKVKKAPEFAKKSRKDALKASLKTYVDDQKPALRTEKHAKRAEKDSQKATLKAERDAKKAALKAEKNAAKAKKDTDGEMVDPALDDLISKLVKIKQLAHEGRSHDTSPDLRITQNYIAVHCEQHTHKKDEHCVLCAHSDIALEFASLCPDYEIQKELSDIIVGQQILKFKPSRAPTEDVSCVEKDTEEHEVNIPAGHRAAATTPSGTGNWRYSLSDRKFIENGWTQLPTEKIVRKMNVYRMRPARPEFDWFEHNKKKRLMQYDTGEKLAEFDDNGRGRWFYRNGRMALVYYDAEEQHAGQRFVIYSNGEPDERGRSRPYTLLATFDYLGNGIVFDHTGKIRLKYNQTEGVVLDRSIGPVSHWKWHTLNDPPVLQQVMIDTQIPLKDPEIMKMAGDEKPKRDDEDMLAIEFDNIVKEKSKKLSQIFKPFQIRMKALKINEHFSLRVLDQATVYLLYRDGTTNLKLNIGMVLDNKEIVDTDTADVGNVSSNMEKLPARTESLAGLQKSIAIAQQYDRLRTERERKLHPGEPNASVDNRIAGISRPIPRQLLTTVPSGSPMITAAGDHCKCNRRQTAANVYYDTRFY